MDFASLPACLAGSMLIATPMLIDSVFRRSLILLFRHSPDGAAGVIVNRSIGAGSVTRLLREHGMAVTRPCPASVRIGGPVGRESCRLLHSPEFDAGTGTVQACEDVAVTDTDAGLRAVADGAPPVRWILVRGYAGWGPGQLEEEIAGGCWLLGDGHADLVYGETDAGKWPGALSRIGIAAEGLSAQAGRA